MHGRVEWDGDFFNTGFVADKETGKVDYREIVALRGIYVGQAGSKSYIPTLLMADSESSSAHGQEEYTERQAKVLELERELQTLIKEAKDISSEAADRVGKVVVEDALYPKTTICLGGEKLTVAEECVGKVEAKIIDGNIKLEEKAISDIN